MPGRPRPRRCCRSRRRSSATPRPPFEPIERANDPFLLPDMGASGVLGDPSAATVPSSGSGSSRAVCADGLAAAARRARRPRSRERTDDRVSCRHRPAHARAAARPAHGRVHPAAVERARLRAAARGRSARARARRHARRPLRRRRRRDHPPADRAAARPHRRGDRGRGAGDPPQPQPHASRAARRRRERRRLRRRRRADAALDRLVLAGAARQDRLRLPARRPSGSSRPGSSGDRPTSTSPSTGASGRRTASTAAPSSAGTRTSSSTTRSPCCRCAVRTSPRSPRSSATAATRSRPGYDMDVYSADFPGPMRDVVRAVTGGECIFFQGAAGNVLPKFAFTDTEEEARRMGTRLGLAALEAVADRYSRAVDGRGGGGGVGDADHALPPPLRRRPTRRPRSPPSARRCRFRSCRTRRSRRSSACGASTTRRSRRRAPRATRGRSRSPTTTRRGRAGSRRSCATARRRRRCAGRCTRCGSATASSSPGRARRSPSTGSR